MSRKSSLVALVVVLAFVDCGGTVETSGQGGSGSTGSTGSSGSSSGSAGGGVVGGSNNGSSGAGSTAGVGGAGALAGAGALGGADTGGTSGGVGAGGVGGSWAECTLTSECIVRPRSCCGACGAAIRGDAIAIRADAQAAYMSTYCVDVGCPQCATPQDPTLLATCAASRCDLVDLLTLPLTACTSDAECKLRTSSCCECEGAADANSLVAIRIDAEADYTRLVCDTGQACDACIPTTPWGAFAECRYRRCTVVADSGITARSR